MSDPNAQFTRGFQGQAPQAGGSDLNEWAKGDATRKLNLSRLGQQANGPSSDDMGSVPYHYTVPPNPLTLSIGLFLAGSFIVFCLSAPIFGTLYPVASGAALATGLATDALLRHVVPAWDSSDRVAISLPAAIVTFWIASRLDHRAAAYCAAVSLGAPRCPRRPGVRSGGDGLPQPGKKPGSGQRLSVARYHVKSGVPADHRRHSHRNAFRPDEVGEPS